MEIKLKLSKFRNDRRGTAEIVGSVMFLVILLFAFTNVYMWHDNASREMTGLLAEKLNSPVSIKVDENRAGCFLVTNNGGFEVGLSRLWLVTSSGHYYADLESFDLRVAAGESINVTFSDGAEYGDGSVSASFVDNEGSDEDYVLVYYSLQSGDVCKILTMLGNVAACKYA